MITIFSTPRPFLNEFKDLQINSIESFLANIGTEIILFDDEELTTSKIFSKYKNINVINNIEYNENKTPKLKSIFNYIKKNAKYDIVVHINSDIIIANDFSSRIQTVFNNINSKNIFLSGRRYNINLDNIKNITYNNLHKSINGVPYLHGKSGLDYWGMYKSSIIDIPNFNCGRPGIDSFLSFKAVTNGYITVDSTNFIKIYHQNHPYPSKKKYYFHHECSENISLAGGYKNMMSLRNFEYEVDCYGKPKKSLFKKIYYILLNSKSLIMILGLYRDIKNAKI